MAPSVDSLDPFSAASASLVGNEVYLSPPEGLRLVPQRVSNRTRKIGGVQVNFVAEFDIDEGARTDLALEASEYDTHAFAEYESWMLLEPIATPAPAPAASA